MIETKPELHKDETEVSKNKLTNSINDAIESENDTLLKEVLKDTHYADIAGYINFATQEERSKIFTTLGKNIQPEMLLEFDVEVLKSVISLFDSKQFSELVGKLDVDDVVYLLEDLNKTNRTNILSFFSSAKRKEIIKRLSYPKDSAGLLMHSKYIAVKEDETVASVLDFLAGNKDLPEECDEIFILNKKNSPVGRVHITKLIRTNRSAKIKKIMFSSLQLIDASLDQEEVSYIFRHYDLNYAPVVNEKKEMLGVIHLDQVVEIIEEEAEEDLMKLGGINMSDLYSASSKAATQRFPWLFFNLLTACLTSVVISKFKDTIEQLVILAAIMPIVASMGGNAGTQSVTIAVRAIANKEITTSNIMQVIFKEVAACAINGIILGILGGVILYLLYNKFDVCWIFALAVTTNFVLAGLWGGLIPITINKIGLDPAVSSSVLLTFLTDFLGFFIFLGLATLLLL